MRAPKKPLDHQEQATIFLVEQILTEGAQRRVAACSVAQRVADAASRLPIGPYARSGGGSARSGHLARPQGAQGTRRCPDESPVLATLGDLSLNELQVKRINPLLDGFDGTWTVSKWAAIDKCAQDTALRDITEWLVLGVLQKPKVGGRSTRSPWVPPP